LRTGLSPAHQDAVHQTRESDGDRYNESFDGDLRDELPKQEISSTLEEANATIEHCRQEHDVIRSRGHLGYGPPTPEALAVAARKDLD